MSPLFSPVSAGGIGKATVTGTTGSPTIDSVTRAGKTIYKFTGSGTITVGTAGTAEILLIGGGGGAGAGNQGAGAGGYVYESSAFLPAGTLTVTVGAGGTSGFDSGSPSGGSNPRNGSPTRVGRYVALGGGAAGYPASNLSRVGYDGGSGGGGADNFYAGGSALLGQGNNGSNYYAGGGAGAAGTANGTGGAGQANSITGTSVTYAGGGGGASQPGGAGGGGNAGSQGTNGGTNLGGGAGGSFTAANFAFGGSGYVVVVIG